MTGRPGRSGVRRRFAPLLGLGLAACASALAPPRVPECAGPLPPVASLGDDFTRRQQVRASAPGVDVALDLAVEKRGDRLVVVGFDAVGAKRVAAVQEDTRLVRQEDFGRPAPIPPGNLLRDVHAAHAALVDAGSRDALRVVVERPGCDYRATFAPRASPQAAP